MKISNAPKVRKPSCEHMDAQCLCIKIHVDPIRFVLKISCGNQKSIYFLFYFRSYDLDLCPTNLNINRLPPLTIRHVCTKFHLVPTFRSDQFFVLFFEDVTLIFVLQTSISIGFLLSPSGICVLSFIQILHCLLKISRGNEKSIKFLFYFQKL